MNTKLFIFVFFLNLLCLNKSNDILKVLTNENYEKSLSESKNTLIVFYNQLCAHSNEIINNLSETYLENYINKKENIVFAKMDASKQKILPEKINIRGYPTMKLYNSENNTFIDWEYDYNKKEIKYFIDLVILNELSIINLEKLENYKNKFQIIMIANLTRFSNLVSKFTEFANKYYLYNFYLMSPSQEIYDKFFIPEKNANISCYIVLFRKYDNFDKRLRIIKYEEFNFESKFEEFYNSYSHPIVFGAFNHRIRKYITENEIISISLFYRKKAIIYDWYIQSAFKNMTRNYILDLKNEPKEFFPEDFDYKKYCFFMIDSEEPMVKRLAFYLGLKEDDMPFVLSYKFLKENGRIYKFKLNQDFQEMRSYYMVTVLNNAFHKNSIDNNKNRMGNPQNKSEKSKVMDIFPGGESFFLKTSHPKHKGSIHLIDYSANYCLHSKKISVLIDKFSYEKNVIRDYYIFYGRLNLYGSDAYDKGIEKVPTIRVFTNNNDYNFIEIPTEGLDEKKLYHELEQIIIRKEIKKEEL